jgi:hypothetical protein
MDLNWNVAIPIRRLWDGQRLLSELCWGLHPRNLGTKACILHILRMTERYAAEEALCCGGSVSRGLDDDVFGGGICVALTQQSSPLPSLIKLQSPTLPMPSQPSPSSSQSQLSISVRLPHSRNINCSFPTLQCCLSAVPTCTCWRASCITDGRSAGVYPIEKFQYCCRSVPPVV